MRQSRTTPTEKVTVDWPVVGHTAPGEKNFTLCDQGVNWGRTLNLATERPLETKSFKSNFSVLGTKITPCYIFCSNDNI